VDLSSGRRNSLLGSETTRAVPQGAFAFEKGAFGLETRTDTRSLNQCAFGLRAGVDKSALYTEGVFGLVSAVGRVGSGCTSRNACLGWRGTVGMDTGGCIYVCVCVYTHT